VVHHIETSYHIYLLHIFILLPIICPKKLAYVLELHSL